GGARRCRRSHRQAAYAAHPGRTAPPVLARRPRRDPRQRHRRSHVRRFHPGARSRVRRSARMKLRANFIDPAWTPEFPVCASPEFMRTVSRENGWIEGIDEAGQRRCVVPYCVIRKGGMTLVRFTSETIAQGELGLDDEKQFLNAVVELLRTRGIDVIVP